MRGMTERRARKPAAASSYLGDPCVDTDPDADTWECIKAQAYGGSGSPNPSTQNFGVAVSLAGLAIVLAKTFVETIDAVFPDDKDAVMACLGKGWAWNIEGRFCADPATPIGQETFCKMIDGANWAGNHCECSGGLTWTGTGCAAALPPEPHAPPEPHLPPEPSPPKPIVEPAEPPPLATSELQGSMSTGTAMLLGAGIVGTLAAAIGGTYLLTKKNHGATRR